MNIVVTGASSGIGAALAGRFGRAGHHLVVAARRERELNDVAHRAAADAIAVAADVTRRADVERLRDRALDAFGSVDVWINNAGQGIGRPALELTDEDFDAMMAVNVKSALYGMQAIVPHFIARGRGHVINVSSMLGRVPLVTVRSAYNAAKAALNALTANVRMDLAAYPGIHVSLVMPGIVTTEFARHALHGTPPPRPGGPPPPMQSADEVAEAIAALVDRPIAELYTNPAAQGMVARYYQDVAAFERGVPR